MKIPKRRFAKNIRDAFRVEPLEPRVLLSADPLTLLAAYQAIQSYSNLQGGTAVYAPQVAPHAGVNGLITTQYVYNASVLAANQSALAPATQLSVQSNDVLSGNGNVTLALANNGIVSLTSTIGAQSFAQTSTGELDVQLGNTSNQLNLTSSTSGSNILAGTLAVSLASNFSPTDGEVFTVMTYASGSVSGKFSNATGLLDVADGMYFQVTQGATSITLTAHKLSSPLAAVATQIPVALDNAVGEWLSMTTGNTLPTNGYFLGATDSFSLGSFFSGTGTLNFGFQQLSNITNPVTNTSMTADVLTLSISNASATLGSSSSGLSLSGTSMDLAIIAPDGGTPAYGWLMGKGLVTSANLSFGAGAVLSSSNLNLSLNMDLGTLSGGAVNNSALSPPARVLQHQVK